MSDISEQIKHDELLVDLSIDKQELLAGGYGVPGRGPGGGRGPGWGWGPGPGRGPGWGWGWGRRRPWW